jgi:hypothetical protein
MVTTLLLICILAACEGGNDISESTSTRDTGSIAFNVAWNQSLDSGTDYQTRAVICGGDPVQVATVRVAIVDTETSVVKMGGPWDCFASSGTIQDVPVGSDYTLLFYGHNEDGRTAYSGTRVGISVNSGVNDIGTIDANQFFSEIISPADGSSSIDPDSTTFSWAYAPGAAEYQLWISESSDLSSPLIFDTDNLFFTVPDGYLDVYTTYYWTAFPIDIYGNRSYFYGDIYRFTTGSGGGGVMDDNYEDNDSFAAAHYLPRDSYLSDIDGYGIAVLGDIDYYSIYVPYTDAILEFECIFSHGSGDIDIELYDADGNYLDDSMSGDDNEYIYHVHVGGAASYYIKVWLFDDGSGTSNTYDLWWSAL